MRELLLFLPIVLFLLMLLLTSIWLENRKTTEKSLEDFYLSDRNLEGFVLAMSMIATYGSVSSFVSGPGVAWQLGLGWVVFAAPQIIAGFLVFGVIGKKFALVGHRIGAVTVISVIILAITSGDTAMRSLRLSLGEMCSVPQKQIRNRLLLCLPLIVVVSLLLWWSNLSASTFNQLWNYFAWGNQVLASCTLTAGTVWLFRHGKPGWITAVPGAFMTFIVTTYILWISPAHGGPLGKPPVGCGLELHTAYVLAILFCLVTTGWSIWYGRKLNRIEHPVQTSEQA